MYWSEVIRCQSENFVSIFYRLQYCSGGRSCSFTQKDASNAREYLVFLRGGWKLNSETIVKRTVGMFEGVETEYAFVRDLPMKRGRKVSSGFDLVNSFSLDL